MHIIPSIFITAWLLLLPGLVFSASTEESQTPVTGILTGTPAPLRYFVEGSKIIDTAHRKQLFFKGIGYSPYLVNETPMQGAPPGNDGRYEEHLRLLKEMNVNYLHVFPMQMPPKFFEALDKTEILYGQDIWVCPYEDDFLAEPFLLKTMEAIKTAIDHVYRVGRPDRLVLFSIGDELQPAAVIRTDSRHPEVRSYQGKHLSVSSRTPSEIAIARLIDMAMDYELTRYGQRHLYCHTSFTHIGPLADRSDIEVPKENVITPDLGDLICLNVYTYARGVRTSPPGSVTNTSYQGYLEELSAKSIKPIFITQVGLSTSPFEPKSWVPGFGGHKVEDVPVAFAAIWKDIKTAKGSEKICGVSFFELNDEWWKSGEDSADSSRHDLEDPEEWFGIYEIGKGDQLIPKGKIPETIKKLYQSH
ncbi:MAG: hypothetical protein J0652_07065 [Desulfobulbaceae bacterium]|nr:hypothetical protein [Desulfobulbaceae bacterium]